MKINESGRSMVEILGVLAIVAVITIVGIVGFNTAMYKHKMNTINQQISTIASNVKNAFAHLGSYNNLDNQMAITMGLIPEELLNKNPDDPTAIVNMFGGNIVVAGTTSATGEVCDATPSKPCDSFVVKITNLPKKTVGEIWMFPWDYLDKINGLVQDSAKLRK